MALHLVKASSQAMKVAALSVSLPFTYGCWVRCATTAVHQCVLSLAEGGSTLTHELFQTTAGGAGFAIDYNSLSAAFSSGGPTTNVWIYVIGRWISTTNRRIVSLRETGQVIHGSSSGSITTGTMTNLGIGCVAASSNASFFDGDIAEYFYASGDIDPTKSGIALTDDFVRNLAYNGPFAFPHVAPLVEEYRSFRSLTPGIAGNNAYDYQPNEVYQKGGIRLWSSIGTPGLISHPPLAGNYVRPGQNLRNGIFA